MTSTFIVDTIMEFSTTILVFMRSHVWIFFMGPSHQNKLLVCVMSSKLFCQVVTTSFMLGSLCFGMFTDK
jgi:hypothetical protein